MRMEEDEQGWNWDWEGQQQLQNWKIKIIFLCRRELLLLYEPLHIPSWPSTTGFHHWLVRLGSGWLADWLAGSTCIFSNNGHNMAAREKINFLPNNRSSRRRVGGGGGGGWVVVRKSYSEMK